jgi:hypothetical protein
MQGREEADQELHGGHRGTLRTRAMSVCVAMTCASAAAGRM